ncbi:pyruvate formate-lyase-activating protein [Kineosporia sp. NBRC 101731]|uniref:pyruvate formate-lyase-activating protein n=1 Tax=Kineosporia sp. NBRC 101731 TaxID=3032199 RepID=UPI0024A463BC|nr:pyruvate formate-lyase-activating protein [Kineosporia sp. NBRC 101731]GLY32720.1 pyruvate formate-lyase-activating enzyme [Kineosporia sp. NBRC 101731]
MNSIGIALMAAPRPPLPGYDPEVWRRGEAGWVHSWDTSMGVDGPGTRFVMFTAGCPLRCQYCENPDTWTPRGGQMTKVDEVLERVRGYRTALIAGKGGVTVSGGEPLAQPRFVANFLRGAREMGLHTALDTAGFLGHLATDEMLEDTDLVLLDIKSFDPETYQRVTGRELAPTLRFAKRLAELGKPVNLRFVLVPGLTDDPANIDGLADFAAGLGNVERVDVLAYHRLGVDKYDRLRIRYRLEGTEPPTWEQVEDTRRRFADRGLTVS